MTLTDLALKLRPIIEKFVQALDDDTALEAIALFPKWEEGVPYEVGTRVRYNGELYAAICQHTSQSDWTPDVTPSLWKRVADPAVEFPSWIQPAGAHDAYMSGDKVSHKDQNWVSTVDNNVWEPGVYGWNVV